MPENDMDNNEKKEYSASKDYNQSISRPNLNLNSTLGINMQNFDSNNFKSVRNRNNILQDEPVAKKDKNKNNDIPEISEVYGDNSSFKEETVSETNTSNNTNNSSIFKKIAPETLMAVITGVLLIVFMLLAMFLYKIFTS